MNPQPRRRCSRPRTSHGRSSRSTGSSRTVRCTLLPSAIAALLAIHHGHSHLQPARPCRLLTAKSPLFDAAASHGCLSADVPIAGRRRQPYILAAGLIGILSWAGLSVVSRGEGSAPSQWLVLLTFTVSNLSTALSDVVVDAMVAEKAGGDDGVEDDLQSWCWSCMAVGGIAGSTLGALSLSCKRRTGGPNHVSASRPPFATNLLHAA